MRALERGDFSALPAGIYGRAMIRQYAQSIGVSPEETLREFAGVSTESDLQPPTPTEATDTGSMGFSGALWMSAVAVCILGTIAASAAVGWYRSTSAAVTSANEVPVGAAAEDIELSPEPGVINTPGAVDVPTTEGELRITSDPAGAQVTVNGIRWDATPLTIRYLPFGEKLIRVTKTGYAGEQRSIELAPDRPVRSVRIELSPAN